MNKSHRPPGPRGYPLLGMLPAYARDPLGLLEEVAQGYGDVARFRLGRLDVWLPSRTDLVDTLLRESEGALGPGISLAELPRAGSIPGLETARPPTGWLAAVLESAYAAASGLAHGEVADVHAKVAGPARDAALSFVFGLGLAADDARVIGTALDAALEATHAEAETGGGPRHRARRARAVEELDALVYPRIRARVHAGTGTDDLLTRLLAVRDAGGRPLSEDLVRDVALAFAGAAMETATLAATWSLHLLAADDAAEAEVLLEAERLPLGPAGHGAGLRYTQAVVLEALRLYPPAWALGREARRDMWLGGYRVHRGDQIVLAPWVLHRDEHAWSEPAELRPERWLDGAAAGLSPFAFFPTGVPAGPGSAEPVARVIATIVVAAMVRRARFASLVDRAVVPRPGRTLTPRGGLPMEVALRVAGDVEDVRRMRAERRGRGRAQERPQPEERLHTSRVADV